MITIYHKSVKEKKLQIIKEFKVGSWVNVENPTEDEIKKLVKDFALEEGHIRDALDPHEVPRLEVAQNTSYIFTRMALRRENQTISVPVLLISGKDYIITVSTAELPFKNKIIVEPNINTTQKTKLLIQLFKHIIGSYNTLLTSISKQVRTLSVRIENISNKEIAGFVSFENVLNDFLSALVPTNTILRNILSGRHVKLYEEDKELVEDLELSGTQLVELCRANLKNIVNIREAYSTIMTNNLNRVIRTLTGITIILTAPMIITSFYGMNVQLPFSSSPFSYIGIIIFTAIISAILLGILIKNRWL